ncbi:MAG: methyltransferase regulatory domain-containing protein, partial [Rickettsiales bacterium]|nr:methyltransferase regulatory domain-containing protein [Rickettsiales bacterium]
PAEKAQGARQVLKFIGEAARASHNTNLANTIEREQEILKNQPDYYLLHEHLEENNYQFYFHEFMAMATKNKLQYLAETSLDKMFSGNFSDEVANVLATSTDIVRTEQYMDFIYDRRFRSTLLCHADHILSRTLHSTQMLEGYVYNRFTFPEGFKDQDIAGMGLTKFTAASGLVLTTDDPLTLCLLKELATAPDTTVSTRAILDGASERLKKLKHPAAKSPKDQLDDALCQLLMRYLFMGGVMYYVSPLTHITEAPKKPKVFEMARKEATFQPWVTNLRQENVNLTPFDNKLIALMDGTRDQAGLCKDLLPFFETQELVMSEQEVPITDPKILAQRLPEFVETSTQRYAALALLVK